MKKEKQKSALTGQNKQTARLKQRKSDSGFFGTASPLSSRKKTARKTSFIEKEKRRNEKASFSKENRETRGEKELKTRADIRGRGEKGIEKKFITKRSQNSPLKKEKNAVFQKFSGIKAAPDKNERENFKDNASFFKTNPLCNKREKADAALSEKTDLKTHASLRRTKRAPRANFLGQADLNSKKALPLPTKEQSDRDFENLSSARKQKRGVCVLGRRSEGGIRPKAHNLKAKRTRDILTKENSSVSMAERDKVPTSKKSENERFFTRLTEGKPFSPSFSADKEDKNKTSFSVFAKQEEDTSPKEESKIHKESDAGPHAKQRVAKLIAAAGVCSRRDAEKMILQGRVALNGEILSTPAVLAGEEDILTVDDVPVKKPEKIRLFLYHKPTGLVTTHKDPEGRPTVFDSLPNSLPRVVSVGRLDLNSEGLLLLTNSGALAGLLENPSLGWKRKYRVRVHGHLPEGIVQRAAKGLTIQGIHYAPMQIEIDSREKSKQPSPASSFKKQPSPPGKNLTAQPTKTAETHKDGGTNSWMTVTLTEGKNREIRRVMEFFGLQVSRLIRLSYGPFQLGVLEKGAVKEVPQKVLKEQLGCELSAVL